MLADRRQYARCRIERPAYAWFARGPKSLIVDASERGIALHSQAPLQLQSGVEVNLELADTGPVIVAAARDAWSDGQGSAGIEFVDLSRDSQWKLQRWLRLNGTLAASRTSEKNGHAAPAAHNQDTFQTPSAEVELAAIAERALLLTNGDGSAIALTDGHTIICRAAAGELAPPLGSQIDPHSGISGACVRLRRLLVCNYAESDPHVDRESCRILGISSIIAAPIRKVGSIVGLIEVFSRDKNAFDQSDCYALQTLAEFIASGKSLDHLGSQPHWGTAPKIGAPWHAAEAPLVESGDALNGARAPILDGAMAAGLDQESPRLRTRTTFW